MATRNSLSRSALKLNNIFTQERNLHADPEDTEREDDPLKPENRTVYRNSHGEEIIFSPSNPPPGYVFIPSGNVFITRNCRKLAQKLYSVYHHQSQKRPAAQIGLYVLRDVFERVKSDFEAKRARIDKHLWWALGKKISTDSPRR